MFENELKHLVRSPVHNFSKKYPTDLRKKQTL